MKHRRACLLACAYAISTTSGFVIPGAAAQTAGPGLVYLPSAPPPNSFSYAMELAAGNGQSLIGPSSSTIVLTTFSWENPSDQTNGATATLTLYIIYGATQSCGGRAGLTLIGRFDAKPGQTFQSEIPGGFTVKPRDPGQYWCLMGSISIQGDPSSYRLPVFGYTANLISGSLANTASAGVQAAMPGAVPLIGHQP
ncbi:hypothetical protein [Methylocystis heyeri]|uniref:Uncharacterized protein n=1 Tax=Methylocystis heyeri TaxID=391905 RepID=A0A6B8KBP0_9HYPH|nr:hypothetical protein [Methylocystis heyeri]QGM44972.1 hypothetical protein H2LOC_004305 [Methylocystis heyeri]